jgi:hypothetical protein
MQASTNCSEQHHVSMEVQKVLLAAAKCPDIDDFICADAYSAKWGLVCNQRYDQRAVIIEPYEFPIEEVVDVWRQQQAILPIETFLIGWVPPGFTMPRDQMYEVGNAGSSSNTQAYELETVDQQSILLLLPWPQCSCNVLGFQRN